MQLAGLGDRRMYYLCECVEVSFDRSKMNRVAKRLLGIDFVAKSGISFADIETFGKL